MESRNSNQGNEMQKYKIQYEYYESFPIIVNSKAAAKRELKENFTGMVLAFVPFRWSDDWDEIDVHDSQSGLEAMVSKI